MVTKRAARIGEAATKLAALAEEELPLVIEFLDHLERRYPAPVRLSVAQIRELAKERARLLTDVPRDVLMARFLELAEGIRQTAVDKGTAVEGDWSGD